VIHVVAGAVIDPDGRVLIAQRPAGRKLAGGWEFPGGKVEPGEARRDALARELAEEIGIEVTGPLRPLVRLSHVYPYGEVLLDVWVVRTFTGSARGLDGQALRWCSLGELDAAAGLLEADKPIVRALRLPERLVSASTEDYWVGGFGGSAIVEGRRFDDGSSADVARERLRGVVCRGVSEAERAVAAGAEFVALAEAVSAAELSALCERVAVPVYAWGVGLEEAWGFGATGVSTIEGI
jgi:mutator protein MutT